MKPRSAAEILAWHGLPSEYKLTPEELASHWNAGAHAADSTWALRPHKRGVGRTWRKIGEASYPRSGRVFEDWEEI